MNLTSKFRQSPLVSNFLSLSIVQGLNFVLPLLTFPYLVRVLGIENFGLISFANAYIIYLQVVTDYGFNLTAVREISIHRDNPQKLIEIFSSVMTIKTVLLIFSFLLLICTVYLVPKFNLNYKVFIFSFGIVAGQVLYPVWFFQGIEKMKFITLLNILSKGIFTIAVFIFVKNTNDILLVPLFNSLGFIVVGSLALFIISRKYGVKFKFQNVGTLIYYLRSGWYIFISGISVTLYTASTTFILGILTNNTYVGYFSIVQRIVAAVRGMIGPVSQTLFPHLAKLSLVSKEQVMQVNKKILMVGLVIMIPFSALIFFFSEPILNLLFKVDSYNVNIGLKIQAFIPTIMVLHLVFGMFTIIVFDRNRDYSRIVISAGIISLFVSTILIILFKDIGASIAILLIEVYVAIRYILYVQDGDLKYW
jgi:PST family polysaccharide transporter